MPAENAYNIGEGTCAFCEHPINIERDSYFYVIETIAPRHLPNVGPRESIGRHFCSHDHLRRWIIDVIAECEAAEPADFVARCSACGAIMLRVQESPPTTDASSGVWVWRCTQKKNTACP